MWAANWYIGTQEVIQGAVLVTELGVELMEISVETTEPVEIELSAPIGVEVTDDIEVDICG